ncbi:LysR family transcriptional regulator [Streptomyces sp. SL13]|uniref:LysR family transcriptional regulator n=1 Tax=Streptantibioticus silvisoli TaxID=2705255 RepID=A0AA90H4Z7_9ACTN|nr:LysR family transcriptional regulator [Streptantibioticus silvisoli]MDI5966952.1 LysR family transcriptional regulator [Streptantibioticus silvisoli]MDI5974193.1 LysR family transcriptional regulator [Streptantibioticus silvisoli]
MTDPVPPVRRPLARRVPDLGSLELLLAVARLGSLSAAAREQGITQPAASGRIRAMERLLGVGLLHRSPSGSRLTGAGVLVSGWAGRIVEAAAEFEAGARALRSDRDSRLRIAASMTVAEYLLPGWLVALHDRLPDTAVSLLSGNSEQVARRVLDGDADLGFVEGVGVPAGLDAVTVATDRLVVVVAPGHPWARRRRPLTARDLTATRFALREPGSGTRQVLEGALAAHGGPAAPLLELDSTTALKAAAVTGAGPAVLSDLTVTDELAARRLVEIPVDGLSLTRELRAVWPTGQRPAGPARELLSLTVAPRAGAGG